MNSISYIFALDYSSIFCYITQALLHENDYDFYAHLHVIEVCLLF